MRRINRCLNNQLLEICQRTIQLEELNLKLHHFLPEALREHCHVGSFTKGCLLLSISDAAWASQLRYSLPELRDKLRSEAGLYQLTSIKVSVANKETHKVSKPLAKANISTKARETILMSSEQCDYLPLKEALQRLAKAETDI